MDSFFRSPNIPVHILHVHHVLHEDLLFKNRSSPFRLFNSDYKRKRRRREEREEGEEGEEEKEEREKVYKFELILF